MTAGRFDILLQSASVLPGEDLLGEVLLIVPQASLFCGIDLSVFGVEKTHIVKPIPVRLHSSGPKRERIIKTSMEEKQFHDRHCFYEEAQLLFPEGHSVEVESFI